MNRFMGMMPREAVEISKTYVDEQGLKVTIEAGPEGWTIMYADMSSEWEDHEASADENFSRAYEKATTDLGSLEEIACSESEECCGEICAEC